MIHQDDEQQQQKKDDGAGLAAGGNDTTVVQTPQLSHDAPCIGEQVRYDFLGAVWTDEVVSVDAKRRRFQVKGNPWAISFSAVVPHRD